MHCGPQKPQKGITRGKIKKWRWSLGRHFGGEEMLTMGFHFRTWYLVPVLVLDYLCKIRNMRFAPLKPAKVMLSASAKSFKKQRKIDEIFCFMAGLTYMREISQLVLRNNQNRRAKINGRQKKRPKWSKWLKLNEMIEIVKIAERVTVTEMINMTQMSLRR